MDNKIERRFLTVEQRATGTDDKPVIEGYAAVFDQETVIGRYFREKISQGAFKRVLSEKPDVVAALNHNWDIVLARTTAGTLSLEETDQGLHYAAEIDPSDTEAMNIYRRVKRGTVTQASFAFTIRAEEWVSPPKDSADLPLRNITEIEELFDVGPCTFGAYPEASAQARSKAEELIKQQAQADEGQEPESDAEARIDPQEQVEIESRRLTLLKLKQPKGKTQ